MCIGGAGVGGGGGERQRVEAWESEKVGGGLSQGPHRLHGSEPCSLVETQVQLGNSYLTSESLLKCRLIKGAFPPIYVLSSTVVLCFLALQSSRSVLSDSLRPHESQHARPPCPSLTPGVYSNTCPSSQ